MPAATTTLALGQASYQLLEAVSNGASVVTEGQQVVETLRAANRGGTIENISAVVRDGYAFGNTNSNDGLGNIKAFNIADLSIGLQFTDADVRPLNPDSDAKQNPSGLVSNANINFLANAQNASLNLGNGDNRLNAARDFVNSSVQSGSGSDNVRIGGRVDGTTINLGDGFDQFTVSRASSDLDVSTGGDGDTALFLGALTAANGGNIVDMGSGNDHLTFLGGVRSSAVSDVSPSSGYLIDLGVGSDTVVFGSGSTSDGFSLFTREGADLVTLGRVTSNALINLGSDLGSDLNAGGRGDTLVLGLGSSLEFSSVQAGDNAELLRLAGSLVNTSLELGSGSDTVEVSRAVLFDSSTLWNLGDDSDDLVFSSSSDLSLFDSDSSGLISLGRGADELRLFGSGYGADNFVIDLGYGDQNSDVIRFGLNHDGTVSYSGFIISGFGSEDVLYIGDRSYGYSDVTGSDGTDDTLNQFLYVNRLA